MKTKALLFIVLSVILQFNLNAQTIVGGPLSGNTVWTVEGNPYILTSTVGIPSGISLTINPGVQISGNYDLLVKGELISIGTADAGIEIQDTRIIFKSTNVSNSEISFTSFDNGGVQLADETEFIQDNPKNSGTLTISDCNFINNSYTRTKGYNSTAFLRIERSNYNSATIFGYYPRSETIKIYDCNIVKSEVTSDDYNKGIFVYDSFLDSTTFWVGCCDANYNIYTSKLRYCTLTGREGGSIMLNKSILLNTSFNVDNDCNGGYAVPSDIDQCIFVYDADVATNLFNSLYEGEVEVSHSTFIQTDGNQNGAGIDNYFGNSIQYSTFVNNNTAIAGKVSNLNNCNFINTNGFLLKNTSVSSINATNNYWGTINESVINSKIYDVYDDINLGQVNYSGYLSAPNTSAPISSPINVFKSASESGIIVNWSPNIESDISGYKIYYNPVDEFTYGNSIDVGNQTSYTISGIDLSGTVVVTAYDNEVNGTGDLVAGHESWFSEPARLFFISDLLTGNSYCDGEEIQYQINTVADFAADNKFIIQLSDITGSFDNPLDLISVETASSVILSTFFPDSLVLGEIYRIRVKSTNPEAYSNIDNVIIHQIPSAEFILDTNQLCGTDTVTVTYSGTGSASATYDWNFSGGNIASSSGQGDYHIYWTSSGLKNISLLVAENGCASNSASQSIQVYQPASSFLLEDVVCANQNTSIVFNGAASDSSLFIWDFDGANIVSGVEEGPYLVNWDNPGNKNVSLIINDHGCYSSQTIHTIAHNPIPTSGFNAPETVCFNGIANIEYAGTALNPASFNWDFSDGSILSGTGPGPYEIMWSNSGLKTVTLNVSENGCSSDANRDVLVHQQTQPLSICMVSVDSTNHNVVVWEQASDNPYDSIFIYKETAQSDIYAKIGSQSANSQTVFVDENSNPAQNSSRYKIAVFDTCGYQSSQSGYHKTIHLTINSGIGGAWNLIWDGYEGFSYSTYNIYRATSDNNLLKIAEQASNTFSYTDLTPPIGTTYYQIEVVNPNPCVIGNLKSSLDFPGTTRSNIVNSNQVNLMDDLFAVYPNPAENRLFVKSDSDISIFDIEVLSGNGKSLIYRQNLSNTDEIDISYLKSGLYLVKINDGQKSIHMKFVKR